MYLFAVEFMNDEEGYLVCLELKQGVNPVVNDIRDRGLTSTPSKDKANKIS